MTDFSQISPARRARIDAYVDRLTAVQLDTLAAMNPEQIAAAIIPGAETPGLGFFWWIIEAAYAAYVIKQAKEKKKKAKKAADAMKKKALDAIAKEKAKLTAIKKDLDLLDKMKAEQGIVGAAARNPLPFFIGGFAVVAGLVYLYKRRKKT
jgi:pyrroloquinoline quinone (PQQ) biosynthesis protein C